MLEKTEARTLYICKQCGHRWFARQQTKPVRCGSRKCQSPLWNRVNSRKPQASSNEHDTGRNECELAWLSRNRLQYANRWIALDGDTLLAVGDTAREVFAAVAGHHRAPLVIQVEPEETNFAGW